MVHPALWRMRSRGTAACLALVCLIGTALCPPAAADSQERTGPAPPPELTGTSTVSGTIRDSVTREGLPGVNVRIIGELTREMLTGPRGEYLFYGQPGGTYTVEYEAPEGYAVKDPDRKKSVTVGEGQRLTVDFDVTRALFVSGKVTTNGGLPVPHAEMKVLVGNGGTFHCRSDSQGEFHVNGIPPNSDLSVVCTYDGLISDRYQDLEVNENSREDIEVVLLPAASIAARVTDTRGEPLKYAKITWTLLRPGVNATGVPLETDRSGSFRLINALPGQYEFNVTPSDRPGRSQRILKIDLEQGQHLGDLNLIYAPDAGLSISGRVMNADGLPLAGVHLLVANNTARERTTTDENGFYTVHDLDPGRYVVFNVEYGSETFYPNRHATAGDTGVDVVVDASEPDGTEYPIEGYVVDAASGAAITRFEYGMSRGAYGILTGEPANHAGFFDGTRELREVHHSSGRFRFPAYKRGPHAVLIRAEGYGQWLGLLEAPAKDLVVALEPEAHVAGVAVGADGRPVAGAFIVYDSIYGYRMPDERNVMVLGRTGPDGYFEVGGLTEGPHKLVFRHEDYVDKEITVTPQRSQPPFVEVVLEPGAVVAGTVYVDGQPVEDALVDVHSPDVDYGYGIGGPVSDDGDYRIDRLPQAEWTLKATVYPFDSSRKRTQTQVIRTRPGEPLKLDIHF